MVFAVRSTRKNINVNNPTDHHCVDGDKYSQNFLQVRLTNWDGKSREILITCHVDDKLEDFLDSTVNWVKDGYGSNAHLAPSVQPVAVHHISQLNLLDKKSYPLYVFK